VSTAIAATLFYLSGNRDCRQKLTEEIRSTFRTSDEIRGQKLSGCLYLRACFDEALRMTPPAAGMFWRESPEDVVVDGHLIPRGTQVCVNTYALHHNERYFPNSFQYQPERWLDVSAETRRAFAPFSLGSRGCIGKSMGYLEASLALAKLVWHFDFERAPGPLGLVGGGEPGRWDGRTRLEEFQIKELFATSHDGPYLMLKRRQE
jgi:cytochrome P450